MPQMKIIEEKISLMELKEMAANLFEDMVKAVVDVEKGLLAVDAELHADLEAALLKEGSRQEHLWGINLYPGLHGQDNFIEFDSLINIKPSRGNRSRSVEDGEISSRIIRIVGERVTAQ